ncbi:DUF4189 domain-containing protein [Xanthomonas sp. SS]|uniref:DUF4189 domain-containing protein n=1 Tax=Xanthomonas sp. SS TaxID=2724122 RepID=UPI001639E065|nr:DUF4189 domain-containing protein [Xanthomonas sp. SS]
MCRFLPLILLFVWGDALSQTACPTGVAPGSAQCGPTQYYAEPPPPTPSGEWITKYGAIASDIEGIGNIGVAEKKGSQEAAEREAIAQCKSLGSKECKVTLWYANQCASLASPYSDNRPVAGLTSPGVGSTLKASAKNALKRCGQKNKSKECSVVYSSCSDPVFRKY